MAYPPPAQICCGDAADFLALGMEHADNEHPKPESSLEKKERS